MSIRWIRQILAIGLLTGAATVWAGTPQWFTYRSADYGFAINYPASMTMYRDRPVKAPEHSMFPVCDWAIVCFQYNGNAFHKTPIQSAGVSVNVLRDDKTETDCDRIETNSPAIETVTINGTLFHYADTGEGGLGSSRSVTAYRAFYQNVCFEVALVVAQSNIGEQEMRDLGWNEVDPRAMHKIQGDMEKMLRSFAFTGPVVDGANWSVYSDSGCGGQFEYPSDIPVEKVVEYSVRAQQSEAITCEQAFLYKGRRYTVAAKTDLKDENALNEWLLASGYPGLKQAKIAAKGDRFTEYTDGTYTDFYFSHDMVFIFSVSSESRRALPSKGNRVLAHLVRNFRIP